MMDVKSFDELVGARVMNAYVTEDKYVALNTDKGSFIIKHEQDSTERVYLEDVFGGKLSDLNGEIIFVAERVSSSSKSKHGGTEEWTFVRLQSVKEDITLRFHGESNGYYSTSVDLYHAEGRINPDDYDDYEDLNYN